MSEDGVILGEDLRVDMVESVSVLENGSVFLSVVMVVSSVPLLDLYFEAFGFDSSCSFEGVEVPEFLCGAGCVLKDVWSFEEEIFKSF